MRQSRPPSLSTSESPRMHLYDHQHSAAYKTSTENTYRGQCYRDKMTRYPLLWLGQWYFNIALHPCQRLITLNGVDTVAFFLRQFHTGKTGFPSTIVAPRQMVQMPDPSRYAVVWLPSFHPETGREYQARAHRRQSVPERQPTGRI